LGTAETAPYFLSPNIMCKWSLPAKYYHVK